jgi:DNA topoisomerase-1
MGKSLVIVESPAKAKTINRFLGEDFDVKSSMGHIRDLPKKEFGVNIEAGFVPKYEIIPGRAKIVAGLKTAAKNSDYIYLATDLDREGEAIAWHLAEALLIPEEKLRRVTFNEITRDAIKKAFANPGAISRERVDAQQTRRILDRIVGYKLSPLLWKHFRKGLSAGRVQSVAVKLIVDREREITNFVPQEYWRIFCDVHPEGEPDNVFRLELEKIDGKKAEIHSESEAKEIERILRKESLSVADFKVTERKSYPFPPLITSTMQQQASIALHLSAKRTMQIAQQLYEGVEIAGKGRRGLITYHRTDSVRSAWPAIGEVRKVLLEKFGSEYVPEKPVGYRLRPGAQAAHEAIRPTSAHIFPEEVKDYLSPEQFRLYDLIWRRFGASQMSPAIYDEREVLAGETILLKGTSRILKFDGHTKLSDFVLPCTEKPLPELKPGDRLCLVSIEITQHVTEPSPRYTEASLIKTLEKNGIGRPSTYATIISTIQERKYVQEKKGRFYATDLGTAVTDHLTKYFPRILDVKFTSSVESALDRIEEAKALWQQVLQDFYTTFEKDLKQAMQAASTQEPSSTAAKEICEKCGRPMVIKFKGSDAFLGCSGYPECRNSRPVGGRKEKKKVVETDIMCEKCGKPMVIREGRYGKFLACSGFPKCRNTRNLNGKPAKSAAADTDKGETQPAKAEKETPKKSEASGKICDKCGKEMVWRKSRFGKFLACSGYPQCRNIISRAKPTKSQESPEEAKKSQKGKKSDVTCDKCGAPMVFKKGHYGPFLACSAYPECKNTMSIGKKKRRI